MGWNIEAFVTPFSPLEEVTYCKQSNNVSYKQPVKVLWEDAAFDTMA